MLGSELTTSAISVKNDGTIVPPASGAAAPPAAKYQGPQTWTGKDDRLKASGVTWEFMKKEHGGRRHNATDFMRAKMRCTDRPLDAVGLVQDLFAHILLLPRHAPDALARPEAFCRAIDAAVTRPGDYLLMGFTVWHRGSEPNHVVVRKVRDFVQTTLVDRYDVGALLVGHDPTFYGKGADFHVHVYHPVLRVTRSGLGSMVGPLIDRRRYDEVARQWCDAHPEIAGAEHPQRIMLPERL